MNSITAGDPACLALIDRPIFIISPPRSGSTLLFETLSQAPDLYTVGGESHAIIEGIPALAMPARNWTSNRLGAEDATADIAGAISSSFYGALTDRDGRKPDGKVRMLEKTPKNALRIPFFDAIWADAGFLFLYRDARQTLASMIEAWLSGKFVTYRRLPDWDAWPWSLLLIPGWEELRGKPLPEIVARQWSTTMDVLLDDLENLAPERVTAVDYDELVGDPARAVAGLGQALGFDWDRQLEQSLPLSRYTLSKPAADKWKSLETVIGQTWPIVAETDARARRFVRERGIGTSKLT